MPLSDLALSVPGVVLLCLLPGMAVATALVPRWAWWERLAAAPALGAGLVGVAGLVMHDLGIGFRAASYVPVALAVVAGAGLRLWIGRADAGPRPGPFGDRQTVVAVIGIALVAGVAAAAIMAATLRNTPLPLDRDSAVHGTVAVAIAQTHDVLPPIAEPVDHSAWVRPRAALEAEAALVSEVGGPAPSSALLPITLLSVLLLPLAIAALCWEVTGRPGVAAAASLLALLTAFPAWPISVGELPLVVGTGIVIPVILAALRAIRGQRTVDALALAATLVAANWVIHGTEILTAAVIGGPLIAAALWSARRTGGPVRAVAGAVACLAGAFAVNFLTRLPTLPNGVPDPTSAAVVPETADFGALVGHRSLSSALDALTGFQPAWQLLALLAAVGAATAVRSRTMRWAIVAELAILALFVDSVSVGVFRRAYVAAYPWATDDRIMNMQIFTLAPLAALGVVTLANLILRVAPRPAWRLVPTSLALAGATLGLVHARLIYTDALASRPVVTTADVLALGQMASHVPAGAVVLSDDGDGGLWVTALTPQLLFESWPYLRSHFDDPRIEALGKACDDPGAIDPRLFSSIDVVYVGAREMPGLPRWDATCIARQPWLRQIATATSGGDSVTVFAVDQPALRVAGEVFRVAQG